MRTEYRIWRRPRLHASHTPGGLHPTLDDAKAVTIEHDAIPDDVRWGTNGEGNHWPEIEDRLLFIGEEQVPESIEDRVQLATDVILECAQYDGEHHKTWVLDQVLRHLTGDRYKQVIAEYCAGEDGPDTYEWDEGIAP